ncbi:MAG: hypothetical protein JWM56_410 [Candidatus Peribacteria bacterium]|nr:hypothetical protein [Candidatus Peribacteria bacterium]
MLKRPTRPLPKKFNRRTTAATRSFIKRTHKRKAGHKKQRWQRFYRHFLRWVETTKNAVRRWYVAVLVGISALVLGLFLFSPIVQVRDIRIQRSDARLNVDKVKRALIPLFGQHLLLLSTHDVEALVRQAVPDMQSVSIHKNYPSQLVLRVQQVPLVARLAVILPQAASASGAVAATGATLAVKPGHEYLTANGLYVSIPLAESGVSLPLIRVEDIGTMPEPGERLVKKELLDRMQAAEKTIKSEFGLKVPYRTMYVSAREFHLSVGRYSLWFDMASPLEDQLQRYRTFLQSPGSREVTRYVDLRLAEAIVYR